MLRFRHISLMAVLVACALAGCKQSGTTTAVDQSPGATTQAASPHAQLFDNMGPHKRTISTSSTRCQQFFDQGLTWAYAFNHDEAIRSFQEAAAADPHAAMPWWGIALCNGPHINNPAMDEAHSKAAWEAWNKASDIAHNTPGTRPTEIALIEALRSRYADPAAGNIPMAPDQRAPLDRAYADAMKKVHDTYPNDSDVCSLYAESLMDLRPWDLWSVDYQPRPETPEIISVIEHGLTIEPNHPGLNHLYVHSVEAGPAGVPAKAIPSADRLRTLVTASGHLVHMAGHIDVRVGQFGQAAEQNRQAIKIDAAYRKLSPNQGFYNIYMAHNNQFLAWACMHTGRKAECLAAARAMMEGIPPAFIEGSPEVIDGYLGLEIEALLRFGEWDKMLAMPQPIATLPIKTAFWRYGRATAYAAKGDIAAAEREQQDFLKAVDAIPAGRKMAINDAHTTMKIAEESLAGEIAFRRGSIDDAVNHLREAVKVEDTLRYIEPPDWIWPTRHQLGAVLMSAGRYDEAADVYKADLVKWPENGWSLFGLSECLKMTHSPEAAGVEARFKKVWANADTPLKSTCMCVTK
jgi:tetratricopeptide (TPR) repeat protein